ncbi:MAG: hypothetical protein A2V66_06810 [Ignavibacteria bacterium RBG_13_36_8]|nr:MAG: hypothetical protein A2V66_06810 [Ignavibacteria bacterium RBG_13_36_8]
MINRKSKKYKMQKNSQVFLIILFLTTHGYSQQIKIEISNSSFSKAEVSYLEGEKTFFIDSIISKDSGKFSFQIENKHTGFYRLAFTNNLWINFIYDGEDVNLQTNAEAVLDNMKVINSQINELYYDFVRLNKAYKTKTDLLQLILTRYPKDDEYFEVTKNRVAQLQNEYRNFVENVSLQMPNSFIERYVNSSQLPIVDFTLPLEEQLTYLKTHALDKVDFNDTGLIYSDVFTNKSIEYLMYYRNPQLPKELLEKEFMVAVDTLLSKAKVNPLVYQHITDYLIDGFKKFGFDAAIDYIVKNYVIVDDLCLDEETESSIQKRIDQAKLLNVGAIVPNVILPDSNGSEIDLGNLNANKTLIVFYSSWCPHCQELLPELYKLYKKQNNLEVYAISLDEEKKAWLDFVKTHSLDWINVSDQKGWNSKAASDYYIYATPTMFLVNRDRKIVGKPLTYDELMKLL